MKTFYICSYGGCGSKNLSGALVKYGKVRHVHSRCPPQELEYCGNQAGGKCYGEWFNGIKIPDDQLDNYCVIYIYKNPVQAILSRFRIPAHLEHIQTKKTTTMYEVVTKMEDLYGINEFYNNYTQTLAKRNYKIHCIKYEDMFDKHDELSKVLNIGPLQLVKKETKRSPPQPMVDKLYILYKDLLETMETNDFLFDN